jgi:hypothetical protein
MKNHYFGILSRFETFLISIFDNVDEQLCLLLWRSKKFVCYKCTNHDFFSGFSGMIQIFLLHALACMTEMFDFTGRFRALRNSDYQYHCI